MDVIIDLLWLAPIVVGLVEVAKRAGLPTRLAGVTAVAFGIAGAFAVGPAPATDAELLVAGAAVGLSAAGLYSAGKATLTG